MTVEAELLAAGRVAVTEGRAASLSAWVNDALQRHTEHDRRLTALDALLQAYETEAGVITDEEIGEATRSTRARAVVVRPEQPAPPAQATPPDRAPVTHGGVVGQVCGSADRPACCSPRRRAGRST